MQNATPDNNNVASIQPLKKEIKALSKIFKGLNYEQTVYVVKEARRVVGLKPDKKKIEKLPEILTVMVKRLFARSLECLPKVGKFHDFALLFIPQKVYLTIYPL